jgi:hypothetical protein
MTLDYENMTEEELRARAEAATLGQLKIMQAAIAALIAVSPKPDYLQFEITRSLAALTADNDAVPELEWVPDAMRAGAGPVADYFVRAASANLNFPK